MKTKNILLLSAAVVLSGQLAPAAFADNYYKGVQERMPADTDIPVPVAGQVKVVGTQSYTTLGAAPDMPFVPQYTGQGKRFFAGKKILNTKTGENGLESNFLVKEDARAVLDWYKTVLKQMQWGTRAESGSTSVTGDRPKDGYKVTVQTHDAPDDSGFRTVLVVHFYAFTPVGDDPGDAQPPGQQKRPQVLQKPLQPQPQR